MLMRRLAGWIAIIALGMVLGGGSAVLMILNVGAVQAVRIGPWLTLPLTGSTKADGYTRAAIAVGGLLALSPHEAIYFTADQDDDGKPLTSACDYAVSGGNFDAGWWSVTAYGADRFLIANTARRFSFSGGTIQRESDDKWTIHASANKQPDNWLPTPQKPARFYLALRLYQPAPAISSALEKVPVPKIKREACR
jgi:hypothetical protein